MVRYTLFRMTLRKLLGKLKEIDMTIKTKRIVSRVVWTLAAKIYQDSLVVFKKGKMHPETWSKKHTVIEYIDKICSFLVLYLTIYIFFSMYMFHANIFLYSIQGRQVKTKLYDHDLICMCRFK